MSDKSPTSTHRLSNIFASLSNQNECERSSSTGSSRRNSFAYADVRSTTSDKSNVMTPRELTLRSLQSTTSSSSNQSAHSDNCAQTLSAIRRLASECRSMPNSPRMMSKHPHHGRPPIAPNSNHLASLTDHLNVQQVNKYPQGEVPEINWQERCLELQLELHRSRSQSERIRGMLRDKVSLIFFFIFVKLLCPKFIDGKWSRESESLSSAITSIFILKSAKIRIREENQNIRSVSLPEQR